MRKIDLELSELKFTASVYANTPAILDHIKVSGTLPDRWTYQQKLASARSLLAERGQKPVLNPDENLVLDTILHERRLPAGAIIPERESASYTLDKPVHFSLIDTHRRAYPKNIVMEKSEIPVVAETVRRILSLHRKGEMIDPWLEFPQHMCSFSFHKKGSRNKKLGVPVGALMVLWHQDDRFTLRCPRCGQKAYGIAFGGLLSVGGIFFVCVGCNTCWFHQLGGLGKMVGILKNSPLNQTRFRPRGCGYGGGYGSDGTTLLKILGITELAERV